MRRAYKSGQDHQQRPDRRNQGPDSPERLLFRARVLLVGGIPVGFYEEAIYTRPIIRARGTVVVKAVKPPG